jgi:uncharacterized protein (TIRG00374 family)
MNRNQKTLFILGFAISIIILLFLSPQIDYPQLVNSLRSVQIWWIAIALILMILGLLLRSYRWQFIATRGAGSVLPFIEAYIVGYCGNLLLPARSGELVKIVVIRLYAGLNSGNAVSSVIFDRLCDGIAVAFFLGAVLALKGSALSIPIGIHILCLLFIAGGIGICLFILYGDRSEKYSDRFIMVFPEKIREKIHNLFHQAREASLKLRDPQAVIKILAISLFVAVIDVFLYQSIFYGLGWNLPILAAVLLMIFISATSVLPSAPGYFGMYQIACIFALSQFGMDNTDAIACSIIIHLLLYGLYLPSLVILSFRKGINFIQMWRKTEEKSLL